MSRIAKALLGVVVVAVVIAVLFLVVFPLFDRTFVTNPVLGAP